MRSMYDHDRDSFDIVQTDSCGFDPQDAATRYSDFPTNESVTIGCKEFRKENISLLMQIPWYKPCAFKV